MIQKYLEVSSDHITRQDAALLDREAGGADAPGILSVDKHRHGWWVWSNFGDVVTEEELLEAGFSASFVELMRYAAMRGVSWIRLDDAGKEIPSLRQHEW